MSLPANYPIESVDNAARILLMLRDAPTLRVGKVAEQLGVARSTAHRMLTTLQARGLLRQDRVTKVYGAGPDLVELGLAIIGAGDLRTEVRPVLESLARSTGETTHLLVLEGTDTVFLDGVEGTHVVRAALRVGHRGTAHASAAGKVLLAELEPAELRRRYPGARLHGGTERALRTRRALEEELAAVRERGYAVNHGESEPDLYAVATAVRDRHGVARGAVSVSGPAGRAELDVDVLGAQLLKAVRELGPRTE